MSEIGIANTLIRDAKYFGARIGDRCWWRGSEAIIKSVAIDHVNYKFNVKIQYLNSDHCTWFPNGEGITFEAPKKKRTTTQNVFYERRNVVTGTMKDFCISDVRLGPLMKETIATFEIEE